MKTKDKKALHSKTVAELNMLLSEKKVLLVKTRMELGINKIKNVHAARSIARDIAIFETIKRQKELQHG